MKTVFYTIECLTNLHVGSGEINYNIVDNEVEKDFNGLPMIHASGIKGALRQALAKSVNANEIFGEKGDAERGREGSHKFLDAHLISRPLRVADSNKFSAVSVITLDTVNRFLKQTAAFGAPVADISEITEPAFGDNAFLAVSNENIKVEGDPTGKLEGKTAEELKKLEGIIPQCFAIAKSFNDYALPVVARNCLVEGQENLWYEEVVPHGSVLYFGIVYPDNAPELTFPNVVQFGGNASIGCGFCKITKVSESGCEKQ